VNVLYVLVPLALGLALVGVAAFRWAVRDGQFDDVDTPALRVLLEDVPTGRRDPSAPPSPPCS
jgi:cbb3-type cytochrome oxidase maturation protein